MNPLKMLSVNSLCYSSCESINEDFVASLLEKTIRTIAVVSRDVDLELEDRFRQLSMSQEEDTSAGNTTFDCEEVEMLARANHLLARCLCLDELDEAARKNIATRANSFLTLYLKKGGRNLFQTVVRNWQSFVHFLLLVHDKTVDLSGSAVTARGVLHARGPARKSTAASYQRHHPYDELSENWGKSRVQLHLAGGESCNRDHPIGADALQDLVPMRTSSIDITQEAGPKDLCTAGVEAAGESPAPSEEELSQSVDYFLACCLSEQERERLRSIFHDMHHFPDLNLSSLSHDFSLEDFQSHDDENRPQDHPAPPAEVPSPADSFSAVSPGSCSMATGLASEACPYVTVERLSHLDISTSSSPLVLLVCRDSCSWRTATEELLARMNVTEREDRIRKLSQHPDEEILFRDEDGDTRLMIACANSSITLEEIFALTERLKNHPQQFVMRNHYGKSALLLAALEKRPLVAGYIAETMVSLGLAVNQTDAAGNNIIHTVSSLGDEFAQVVSYLLRVKTSDGKSAFDLSAFNYKGKTALHEAIASHVTPTQSSSESCTSYEIVQLLLTHGASAAFQDATSGRTSVHCAIEKQDLRLLEIILVLCPSSANALSYNDNTPLHIAGTLLNVTEEMQLRMLKLLLKHGADKTRRNKAKKLPIEVVPRDKAKIKELLMARPRQSRPS